MEGFDLRVNHRDKDGAIVKSTPYRLRISRDHGAIFERDGKKYYPDGKPVMSGSQREPQSLKASEKKEK